MSDGIVSGGVAVITGSAGGIGLGIARAAAARGMRLVLADIAAEQLACVAKRFETAGHEVLAVPTDVTDPAAIDRLAAAVHDRFGSVRLLVNNAGIEMLGNSWEFSTDQWERAMRTNVLGPVHGVRAFAGAMVAAGEPAFIANVASVGALSMAPEQAPYLMSKHAVLSFSECLFLEMKQAAATIRVSVVLPGPVKTRIFSDAPAGGGDTEAVAKYRAEMDGMLTALGMPPDEAGKMILDQIVDGRFWVTTHPEMLSAIARTRATYLTNFSDPSIPVRA